MHDVIVLGLGATGSAALYQLAKRGMRALGLDRHAPPHGHGSSHGESRITRQAIGEGAHYTPLVLRSHEIWRAMEAETDRSLLTVTGGLIVSSPEATSHTHVAGFFDNTCAAARAHGIGHEILDAAAIRARFPQFRVGHGERGYFEPGAGYLHAEACVSANLELAKRHGATIATEETVLSFARDGRAIAVRTDKGTRRCDRLVVAAGPWLPSLLDGSLSRLFRVMRQLLFWFAPDGDVTPFLPARFPVFIWEVRGRPTPIYGIPAIGGEEGGVKIGTEQLTRDTSPDCVERTVGADEIHAMHADYVAPFVLGLSPRAVRAETCLYTVTPDAGFVVDTLPGEERVIVASPCSGHGFKHSAALGEAIAERLGEGTSRIDLAPFGFARFR